MGQVFGHQRTTYKAGDKVLCHHNDMFCKADILGIRRDVEKLQTVYKIRLQLNFPAELSPHVIVPSSSTLQICSMFPRSRFMECEESYLLPYRKDEVPIMFHITPSLSNNALYMKYFEIIRGHKEFYGGVKKLKALAKRHAEPSGYGHQELIKPMVFPGPDAKKVVRPVKMAVTVRGALQKVMICLQPPYGSFEYRTCVSFSHLPKSDFQLPNDLCTVLFIEESHIARKNKVYKLPATTCTDNIVQRYFKANAQEDQNNDDLKKFITIIQNMFDQYLPTRLLYKQEHLQYCAAVTNHSSKEPFLCRKWYGGHHLLRLFAMVYEDVNKGNIRARSDHAIVMDKSLKFLAFMTEEADYVFGNDFYLDGPSDD